MLPYLFAAALTVFVGVTTAHARDVPVASVPSWVVPIEVPKPSTSFQLEHESLLIDTQERVERETRVAFHHIAYALHSAAGVQNASELTIDADADQELVWHFVRRIRAGQRHELLPRLRIRRIQPESHMGLGLYTGSTRDIAILDDVRPGDVIEYSYSVRESTRGLGGRFAAVHWLGRDRPVRRIELRVSWPEGRNVAVRTFGVDVERPTSHSVLFSRADLPAFESESLEPSWLEVAPRVELSEFASWADVASWAVPLYEAPPGQEVRERAASLANGKDDEERMASALRFVQEEVRYLGIEEGELAYRPDSPSNVLARRFGDCKGKALLLVSLLRLLGFEANVALVSSHWEKGLAKRLPSPLAFDHAIVSTKLQGKALWFDATAAFERGPVRERPRPTYGYALVIAPNERSLREIGVFLPEKPTTEVREVVQLRGAGGPRLDVTTTYLGYDANRMRERLANQSREDLERTYLDFYGKGFGDLEIRAPLEIEDDDVHNRIRVTEHYKLSETWKNEEQSAFAWLLEDLLPLPEASRKERPLRLAHPFFVRQVIELYDREGWDTKAETGQVEAPEFSYTYRSYPRDLSHVLEHELRSTADHVTTDGLKTYSQNARRVRDLLSNDFVSGDKARNSSDKEEGQGFATAGIIVLAALGVWGMVAIGRKTASRRRRRQFARKQQFARGEAPEAAIAIERLADLGSALSGVTCCKHVVFGELPEPSEVRYGEGLMRVYRQACAGCGRSHTRYLRLAADAHHSTH